MGGGLVHVGLSTLFGGLASWVAGGTAWLVRQVEVLMAASNHVPLGTPWFSARMRAMTTVAGVLALPMVLLAALRAVVGQDPLGALRALLVRLPLAALGTFVAAEAVSALLGVTDELCVLASAGLGRSPYAFLGTLASSLTETVPVGMGGAIPSSVVLLGAVLGGIASLVVWLELVLRSAAVAVVVALLPVALVAGISPWTAHWCRRGLELVVGLVVAKLVVVVALDVGAAALASGAAHAGFSSLLTGIGVEAIAALAPLALFRLAPVVEAEAMSHAGEVSARIRRLASRASASAAMAGAGVVLGPEVEGGTALTGLDDEGGDDQAGSPPSSLILIPDSELLVDDAGEGPGAADVGGGPP